MTTPNEPGYPGAGAGSGDGNPPAGSGGQHARPPSAPPPGSRATDTGEAPVRPRADAPPRPAPPQPTEPPPARPEAQPPGHSPGVDARLRRFVTGTAAPGAAPARTKNATDDAPARKETPPTDAYASEIPDLSGSNSRAAQRKPAVRQTQVAARPRGPVRASMQIRRIDPWSTLKVSLLLSVALFFVWMLSVAFLYLVLGSMGVWSKLNSNVGDLLTNTSGSAELVSSGSIFGAATLIGLVNIVLLTAMATLGAVIYNLSTDVVGGVEVTLADRD